MRNWLLAIILLLGLANSATAQAAGPEQYWIIAPVNPTNAVMQPRPKTPYAYGWFGVTQTHCTGTWHHGNYKPSFIDWTFR